MKEEKKKDRWLARKGGGAHGASQPVRQEEWFCLFSNVPEGLFSSFWSFLRLLPACPLIFLSSKGAEEGDLRERCLRSFPFKRGARWCARLYSGNPVLDPTSPRRPPAHTPCRSVIGPGKLTAICPKSSGRGSVSWWTLRPGIACPFYFYPSLHRSFTYVLYASSLAPVSK